MTKEYFINTNKITFKDKKYIPNFLPNTWFVQEPIDLEHKHWKLLAYLKRLDENIKKGFLYPEYELLKKRYKDLESYLSTCEIVNKDKESEKLFSYIYDMKNVNIEEIEEIVENSLSALQVKYFQLKTVIKFLNQEIKITNKQLRDGRKKLNIYIEMCNCSIVEHYTISKSGHIDYIGSFHIDFFEDNLQDNIIEVKTTTALNSKGIIIPHIIKTNLLMN